jgi:glycerol-3-phosphate acyltransferase PlsY
LILFVCAVIGSYLAGSIPFSYVAGKLLKGVDLRDHGSGNLGASNTFRILGAVPGAIVLLLDIAKGFFPVFVAARIAGAAGVPAHWIILSCAFAAVLGHMFSVYLRFSGGKGIATSAGAFLAITPYATLGACVVFAVVFATRRIMSLATLSAAVSLPVFVFLVDRFRLWPSHWSYIVVTVALVIVIFYRHRSNIRRLMAGTEPVLARKKHV